MKDKVKTIAYLPGMLANRSRNIYISYTISAICHLFLFLILIFIPGLNVPQYGSHSVINANVVALPAKGRPVPVSAIKRAIAKKPVKKTKKKLNGVSLVKPTKKVKTALKKTNKSPLDKIKDEADESRPSSVDSAIERIRSEVEAEDARRLSVEDSNKELAVGVESGVQGGSGIGSGGPVDIYSLYLLEIKDIVQQNWAYSESLAGAKSDLQTLLVFEVMPNGDIRDIWFTEKSGNTYLDESAYKAVLKSAPFPPYPKELSRPTVTVPLRFTPKGLQE
jgi:colicin import membrane protein